MEEKQLKNNVEEELVSKKVMAYEVWKQVNISKNVGVSGIASTLIVAALFSTAQMAGAVGACIMCGLIGWFIARDIKLMNYLEQKYNLPVKKQKISFNLDKDGRE